MRSVKGPAPAAYVAQRLTKCERASNHRLSHLKGDGHRIVGVLRGSVLYYVRSAKVTKSLISCRFRGAGMRTDGEMVCRSVWRLVLGAALLGTVLAIPPLSRGATAPAEQAICDAAETLIENALPQQAQKLLVANLEASSANPCLADTKKLAKDAIDAAKEKANEADTAVATNPGAARESVDEALKLDRLSSGQIGRAHV